MPRNGYLCVISDDLGLYLDGLAGVEQQSYFGTPTGITQVIWAPSGVGRAELPAVDAGKN